MIYIADCDDEGKRLDTCLTEVLSNISRSKIQAQIKEGNIKVNGEIKKASYQLKEDDKIEVIPSVTEEVKIEPENIPLDIIYEDDNMCVINKPSGMLPRSPRPPTRKSIK